MQGYIRIRGARVHNLKNLDVDIPKDKLVVITGLSGSGKSSLAFDTIYAEGQRRFVESLSSYARQFLGIMDKPDVDVIEGLSPAISIDQKSVTRNPRSTVGTITEIYDYLRLLYARLGKVYCYNCGQKVEAQTVQMICDSILKLPQKMQKDEVKLLILSPLVKSKKGRFEELFSSLVIKGFARVKVDDEIKELEDEIALDKFQKHDIEVVIDRLVIKEDSNKDEEIVKRLTDSIETGVNMSDGEIIISSYEKEFDDILFSEKFACAKCHISFPSIEPHTFSFNSPYGACLNCSGLGVVRNIEPTLLYNPNLSITEGGIYPWSRNMDVNSWRLSQIEAVAKKYNFNIRKPLKIFTQEQLNIIFYGSGDDLYKINYSNRDGRNGIYESKYEGIIPNLERRYKETDSDYIRREIEQYMVEKECSECKGKRLKKESLSVFIDKFNIHDVTNMNIENLSKWINDISEEGKLFSKGELEIGSKIFREISTRLNFLSSVGLSYLTLSRKAGTLSGGEAQRIRLASQIGTGLTGVLYVLDEPSIGLHQKDNERLLLSLKKLRDLGNSVLVVEHDEDTMYNSDWIIDLGLGAGEHGGNLIAEGDYETILKNENSITAKYLRKERVVGSDYLGKRREGNGKSIEVKGAKEHNLKNIDVKFPLGKFICVTGVSGSGKSSLINDVLYESLSKEIYKSKRSVGIFKEIKGIENIDKVIDIDQSPIGRTPRSNPATYTGLFTFVRDLFAKTTEARARGYKAGRFSFNVKGGRCEVCRGDGVIKIEMQFLPDLYIECEECMGKRYNREALQIDYKGKSIADILDMTVEEALDFFDKIPLIKNKLKTLEKVGLSYVKLGQRSTTLSGGEAQRIKLATELSKRSTGKTLYILDEPTTGLHFADIDKLLEVLHSLVDRGNTVIVIEHNLDVIKTADWVIDLGPDGGDGGGKIVAEGTPEEIMNNQKSYTGNWLKRNMGK